DQTPCDGTGQVPILRAYPSLTRKRNSANIMYSCGASTSAAISGCGTSNLPASTRTTSAVSDSLTICRYASRRSRSVTSNTSPTLGFTRVAIAMPFSGIKRSANWRLAEVLERMEPLCDKRHEIFAHKCDAVDFVVQV